jgi:hypothetical protein
MRQAISDSDAAINTYEAQLEAELDARHAPVSLLCFPGL